MRALAALVHVFTALGVVCALFATDAVIAGDMRRAFVWLAIALVIDAVDGSLARRVDVTAQLPRFSGERLDLVIDYVTYVFVPVLALLHSRNLEGTTGTLLACGILMSSLFHFSDLNSKTEDNCFVGFPAIWNIFAFYVLALSPPGSITILATAIAIALTFVPMPWVHPLRVKTLRPLTLAMTGLAGLAGLVTLAQGFPASPVWKAVLIAAAVYYVGLALLWWVRQSERV